MTTMRQRIAPLREASPLALHGPWAAFLTREGVTLRALDSGERRHLRIHAASGLGVLADGSFLVVTDQRDQRDQRDGAPAAIRITPAGRPQRLDGPIMLSRARARVLPLADPGAFLCASPGDHAWHHRSGADGALELLGWIEIDRNGHDTVAAGPGDSITFAIAGEIVRRHLDKRESRHAMPGTLAWHLAPGPGADLVWLTTNERVLQLVRLAGAAEVLAAFPLDGTPVHLAAAGDHAAVVIGQDDASEPFSLAVFGAEGERWRAPIAEPNRLREMHVASSASHVAVLGKWLEAWTVDGRPVALERAPAVARDSAVEL